MKNKMGKKLRAEIVGILKEHGIKKAGLFGSYATGKQKKESDIDILIKPKKKFQLVGLGRLGT